jgi:hypothetical protein
VSRRAVGYFVEPGEPDGGAAEAAAPIDDGTAEFDVLGERRPPVAAPAPAAPVAAVPRVATVVLPVTRSGAYEREPVDARLAELESQLDAARAELAAPRGVEAEIQHLGAETAEILRVAHHKAEELLSRANAEAAALRASARADAEAVTQAAERRLRELDAETDLIWAERTRLTDDTLRLAEALREIAQSAVERFPAATDEVELPVGGSGAPEPEPGPRLGPGLGLGLGPSDG